MREINAGHLIARKVYIYPKAFTGFGPNVNLAMDQLSDIRQSNPIMKMLVTTNDFSNPIKDIISAEIQTLCQI
jgi:predicted lactoylglutathione lyase